MRSRDFKQLMQERVRRVDAVEPRCPHVGDCGGCAFQDREYAGQVAAKQQVLREIYAAGGFDLPLEVIAAAQPDQYRTRMDYVALKDRFGLRARGRFNYVIDLTTCHLIPPEAFTAVRTVYDRMRALGLPDYNLRSHEGFLRYLVVRRSPQDQLLFAAITNGTDFSSEMEQTAATALAQPQVIGFHWLINDGLTDISFGRPHRFWGAAELPMTVGGRTLLVEPNTFFQNNVHLVERLIGDVAAEVRAVAPQSAADLYGGVGTIAVQLADSVAHVDCVEEVRESTVLAGRNAALNGLTNINVVNADVAAYLREQQGQPWQCVVVDPPRVGLGERVTAELLRLQPQRIVYVSCNPLTQVTDLQQLSAGYTIASLRGYDMFPHTPHVETLAVLERRV
jgi:23S rRNA (uracil-5-)-methyltransferase RumA